MAAKIREFDSLNFNYWFTRQSNRSFPLSLQFYLLHLVHKYYTTENKLFNSYKTDIENPWKWKLHVVNPMAKISISSIKRTIPTGWNNQSLKDELMCSRIISIIEQTAIKLIYTQPEQKRLTGMMSKQPAMDTIKFSKENNRKKSKEQITCF